MTLPAHLGSTARRVANVLRSRGPRTRAELIGLTGLSRPTVSAALADLTNAGLLTEEAAQTGPAGGRPATVFRLARGAGLAVGVDIGRRHVRVAVADLGHHVLVDYPAVLDLDADDYPESALDAAARQVDAALDAVGADRSEVVGVGLSIFAPLTRTGRIGSPALLPAWADLLPEEELAGRLQLPVRADNDANLGALGEYVWGAGQQSADLVYVKVATGIGAGIVLDGRLYRGFSGTAGELGHITLDARGPVCRCGNRGCVELSAGGRALLRHARITHPQLDSLVELVDLATLGDPGCRRLLADAGRQLGFALGALLNLINPERIVVGGELGAATELLLDPMRGGLADTAMAAAAAAAEVVPAQLGAQASALGGVALALGVDRAA